MEKIKLLFKCIIYGFIWVVIAAIVAFIIKKNTSITFEDGFFVIGIVLVISGFFSSMGGDSIWEVNFLGQGISASYSNYSNLEVKRREKTSSNLKRSISFGISGITLIVGGLITMFIGYII